MAGRATGIGLPMTEYNGFPSSQSVENLQSFAFNLISRKLKLKLDLHSQGEIGIISLIDALIRFGICEFPEIVNEVTDILGANYTDRVIEILTDGEGHLWHRWDDEIYSPIHSY